MTDRKHVNDLLTVENSTAEVTQKFHAITTPDKPKDLIERNRQNSVTPIMTKNRYHARGTIEPYRIITICK